MTTVVESGEANRLRKNSLGVGAVTFLVVSAAAPLTAVAGGVPLSMLMGNGAGIPGTFLIVTAVLLIFAVGYVAMARHVTNAGAFYAYTAKGLGGALGGAAALIAILSSPAFFPARPVPAPPAGTRPWPPCSLRLSLLQILNARINLTGAEHLCKSIFEMSF